MGPLFRPRKVFEGVHYHVMDSLFYHVIMNSFKQFSGPNRATAFRRKNYKKKIENSFLGSCAATILARFKTDSIGKLTLSVRKRPLANEMRAFGLEKLLFSNFEVAALNQIGEFETD